MKKLFLVCLVAALTIGSVNAQQQKNEKTEPEHGPKIVFAEQVHNYGTIQKGADGNCTFTFTNVGTAPLEFLDVDYSCGCISATYPEKPVKPGKKGEIKVTFNTDYKDPGKFYYKVYFAVTGWPENFVLRLKGDMTEN